MSKKSRPNFSSVSEFLNSDEVTLLQEMGFNRQKAEEALEATGYKGISHAVNWLLASEKFYEANIPLPEVPKPARSGGESTVHVKEYGSEGGNIAIGGADDEDGHKKKTMKMSLLCEKCGLKFQNENEMEVHAIQSGHVVFTQSEQEPLTEEEKKNQLKKVENLIKQRRLEKEEQLQREEIEKEKTRRKSGQELIEARQRLQEQEQKRLADVKKREKLEAKLSRQKVLEDIERDKIARRERFNMPGPSTKLTPIGTSDALPKVDYNSTRIQIRLTNGDILKQTFGANEELAAVRLYVELNRTDGTWPFTLLTAFPKKIFTEEEMSCPLKVLGLVPSAVLVVNKKLHH